MSKVTDAVTALREAAARYEALPVVIRSKPGVEFFDPINAAAFRKEADRLEAIAAASAETPSLISDPPEGCNRVIDCAGDQWTRMLSTPNVWEFGISKRGWAQLVKVYGPVTPLIPGDPIEAPGEEK